MNLLMLLNETSPWVVALGLVAVAEVYSIGLMLLFRTRMGAERLALNNEVAGFKFAVVGVFYAVLLAFVVVAVWEDYPKLKTRCAMRRRRSAICIRRPTRCRRMRRAMRKHPSPIPSKFATSNGGDGQRSGKQRRCQRAAQSRRGDLQGKPDQLKDVALYHHSST